MPLTIAKPGKALLDQNDHKLILIDHEPQKSFTIKSIDAISLPNDATLAGSNTHKRQQTGHSVSSTSDHADIK